MLRDTYQSDFIFITHIPKGDLLCISRRTRNHPQCRLLCKEVEISSGGRRMDDSVNQLRASIMAAGMDPRKTLVECPPIFKFGMPPHGGFRDGTRGRSNMLISDRDNVRQATLFPAASAVASQHLQKLKI